ncbi:MAG: DUF504 domain-containing protein [Alphaproteobacteria bacterium]|nr:DUF504 domain-containing protein [Alphaproteobacteria bacterium]
MRTADRAHAQIRWDPRLDERRFTVGVDVHAAEPKVIPFTRFVPGGDIPWHRVLFFACDGVPCWDRTTGHDGLDALAEAGEVSRVRLAAPWRARSPVRLQDGAWRESHAGRPLERGLSVLTWNVLWDRFERERIGSAARWPLLLQAALDTGADLIAFQEVDPAFHFLVLDHPEVRADWWVSHGPGHPDIGDRDLLLLGRVEVAQVALLELGPHKGALAALVGGEDPVLVVTTHLSSAHRAEGARHRAEELTGLFGAVGDRAFPTVLLGDLNLAEEGPVLDTRDAWLEVRGNPEPTFDPGTNPLSAVNTISGRAARLDRVLLLGELRASAAERLGTSAVDGIWLSDHAGVLVRLERGAPAGVCLEPASSRSALAWVPAEPDPSIQAVRRRHDPAYTRWPPHVNVLWGFVGEPAFDVAAPLVADVLSDVTPFPTVFDRTGTFGRGDRRTHHLAPADPAPWVSLHRALSARFPALGGRPSLAPHLTVARGDAPPALPDLIPWGAHVDALVWLTRRGAEPFAVRAVFPLGTGRVVEPVPTGLPGRATPVDDVVDALRGVCPDLRVVGSRALGVAIEGSDLDVLWLEDVAVVDVVERVRTALPGAFVEAVEKNGLAGVRAVVRGLAVDVVPVAPDDPAPAAVIARSALEDLAQLREALDPDRLELLREVKRWARVQRLDDAALGGLEGLAWAVLVAASPGVRTLAGFVERWAAHDWSVPVGLSGAGETEGEVTVLTPAPPIRNIARRALRRRVEGVFLRAWEGLEEGRHPLAPPDWHRRHRRALEVRWDGESARGAVRGRARALLDVLGVAEPWPTRDALAFGLAEGAEETALQAGEEAMRGVRGVRVAVVDSERVGSR